jgi:hypothetical protein
MRSLQLRTMLSGFLCLIALTGCTVTTHDKGDGKKDDVDIRTPFGSLSVKEGNNDIKDTGLSPYPGARVKKDSDDDKHSANVNISSSLFGLKVVSVNFETDDPSDKVLAFYRKDMGKYGKVLNCTGDVNMNMNFAHKDKDSEVTCHGEGSDHEYKEQLKVGTENNQRIVAVKPKSNGAEFTLVFVRAWGSKDTN